MHTRRILLVDALDPLRQLLTEIFEQEGYHVETATTGAEVLDAAARASFDLIILTDLDLPLLGGRDLAKALTQRLVHTPIIAISADPARRPRESSLPVTAVIGKPFPLATLLALVDEVIQGTERATPDAAKDQPA